MYIPALNKMTDRSEILAFMQRFSFATIITARDNLPVATHLPFMATLDGDDLLLSAHFAKANNQWHDIETQTNLVIFSEPHAYISPQHYEKEQNVPTWNYLSVHAYGKARILSDATEAMALIEKTILFYETAYKQQWDTLPANYRTGLLNGIVAFTIVVTDLQAKKKLSQNKTRAEQQNIIRALSAGTSSHELDIADYMKKMQ